MSKYAFEKGYGQVTINEAETVKNEIMSVLNITTRQSWLRRLSGKVEPKASEKDAIEEVFRKRGIINVFNNS